MHQPPPDPRTRKRPTERDGRALTKSVLADGNRWVCDCPRCNVRNVAPLYRPALTGTCRVWGAFDVVRELDVIEHYGALSWSEVEMLAEVEAA